MGWGNQGVDTKHRGRRVRQRPGVSGDFGGRRKAVSDRLALQGPWFDPWVGKILWRRKWQTTPVFLPGESQGGGSLQ